MRRYLLAKTSYTPYIHCTIEALLYTLIHLSLLLLLMSTLAQEIIFAIYCIFSCKSVCVPPVVVSAATVACCKASKRWSTTSSHELALSIVQVNARPKLLCQTFYSRTNNGRVGNPTACHPTPAVTSPEPPFLRRLVPDAVRNYSGFFLHVPDLGVNMTKQGCCTNPPQWPFAADLWVLPLSQVYAPRCHWYKGSGFLSCR